MCPTYLLWHNSQLIKGLHKLIIAMRWSSTSHHPIKSLSKLRELHRPLMADGYTQCTTSIGSLADSLTNVAVSINRWSTD